SGGLLISSDVSVSGGVFTQTGGTNQADILGLADGGSYILSSGELDTDYSLIGGYLAALWSPSHPPSKVFTQQEGTHSVKNDLVITNFAAYDLQAGTVAAQNINLGAYSELSCRTGIISN